MENKLLKYAIKGWAPKSNVSEPFNPHKYLGERFEFEMTVDLSCVMSYHAYAQVLTSLATKINTVLGCVVDPNSIVIEEFQLLPQTSCSATKWFSIKDLECFFGINTQQASVVLEILGGSMLIRNNLEDPFQFSFIEKTNDPIALQELLERVRNSSDPNGSDPLINLDELRGR